MEMLWIAVGLIAGAILGRHTQSEAGYRILLWGSVVFCVSVIAAYFGQYLALESATALLRNARQMEFLEQVRELRWSLAVPLSAFLGLYVLLQLLASPGQKKRNTKHGDD